MCSLISILLLVPEIFLLVEQIRPRRTQINDLRTPVAVFFQPCAFEAVKGVADALAATDDAFILIIAERALVADAR